MGRLGRSALMGVAGVVVAFVVWSACTAPIRQRPVQTVEQERGRVLYEQYCVQCHGGATGGSIMDLPPPHNANGHTWHHPDCQLTNTVLNGSGEIGDMMRRMMGANEDTPRMPAFRGQLTEEDVGAVLAYIKTWWTAGQRAAQARHTEQAC